MKDSVVPLASEPEGSISPPNEARWQAVVRRDGGQASGGFVYGVRTTGVYCRPGCASRLPRRENVRFFDSGAAAEQAGFRACKRCHPNAAQPDRVRRPCPYARRAARNLTNLPQSGIIVAACKVERHADLCRSGPTRVHPRC